MGGQGWWDLVLLGELDWRPRERAGPSHTESRQNRRASCQRWRPSQVQERPRALAHAGCSAHCPSPDLHTWLLPQPRCYHLTEASLNII